MAGPGSCIARSTDAVSWTTHNPNVGGLNSILAVAYGNGLWVSGGENGVMATSTDGVTWTSRISTFGKTAHLVDV